MIDKETIQRIMDTARIEEVIGDFVSLKRRGANYLGCCPFHNEKTPSFSVSPSKGFYKCFGCGESGNAVGFVMKHEHYTYPEALRYLAKKYNIQIVEEEVSDEQRQRDSERDALYHVSEFAQKYFAQQLFDNEMGRAIGLSYFHQRGLTDDTIKAFGLGYCQDEWRDFTDHARHNGYSDQVLEKTGLTIFKDDKCYDRFRGRVMFPIYSIAGRVLGFSGRILSKDKSPAKYVNSPDSDIYNKSHTLYGLYQARHEISRKDKCYLVEGNVDVVSMYQSGVMNTVASCGTSLTVEQIRLIKRLTTNVTILYDGDAAGIKASKRAVNMLYEAGMHVSLVLFPDQEDPDSYAQKYGSTQLQDYLREHEENFILYKTHVLTEDIHRDPLKKSSFVKELIETIALVPDMMERTTYIAQCSTLLNVPEQQLASELSKVMLRNKVQGHKASDPDAIEPASPGPDEPAGQSAEPSLGVGKGIASEAMLQTPLQLAEQDILSQLLNYGDRTIVLTWKDDKTGEKQSQAITVARFIVDQFNSEQMGFSNPLYQQIFDIFASSDEVPDYSTFSFHTDEALRRCAISFFKDDYVLSPEWGKKSIYVPDAEHNLSQSVQDSVNAFKLARLDSLIFDLDQRWKESSSDDEILEIMSNKSYLIKLRRDLLTALNRVVT